MQIFLELVVGTMVHELLVMQLDMESYVALEALDVALVCVSSVSLILDVALVCVYLVS